MRDSVRIITTSDGSHSLFNPQLKETYHSTHGALTESRHVFIQEGIEYLVSRGVQEFKILEVGFGTGLNALLVWEYALKHPAIKISYSTLEPFPLEEEIYSALNYAPLLNGPLSDSDLLKLHACKSSQFWQLSSNFTFVKYHTKLEDFKSKDTFNLVFYDAFAPSKQAEMWGIEVLKSVELMMVQGGILTTYCAQGQFKRNLSELNLEVETLKGPPGKKEMVRGLKKY